MHSIMWKYGPEYPRRWNLEKIAGRRPEWSRPTGLRIKELLGNDPNPRGVFGVPPKEPNQKTANEVCVCVSDFVVVFTKTGKPPEACKA